MITEKGIPEGGVTAEVRTDMNVIDTGTGMTIVGDGVQVQVLITQEDVAGTDTVMSIRVEVDQLTGSYLIWVHLI